MSNLIRYFILTTLSFLILFGTSLTAHADDTDDFLRKIGMSKLSAAKLYQGFVKGNCQALQQRVESLRSDVTREAKRQPYNRSAVIAIHKDRDKALRALLKCLQDNGSDYRPTLTGGVFPRLYCQF